jgi:hypothetical protein
MAGNRAVAYMGPHKLEIQNLDYPKLVGPGGRKCDHGVILKLVVTNICGSDQHIYRGRFPAPVGMILGHENTGEVVEVGRDVEFIKKGGRDPDRFSGSPHDIRNRPRLPDSEILSEVSLEFVSLCFDSEG